MPPEVSDTRLLSTEIVTVRDVICPGQCRHESSEECSHFTCLVFPYRGVYVRHLDCDDAVADANQVLFFNQAEGYRISHPLAGDDASLVLVVEESVLRELVPKEQLRRGQTLAFSRQRVRIDARAQALAARLRHSLNNNAAEPLEAETLALTLMRRAVGVRTNATRSTLGKRNLVGRAKLALSSDLTRRWTLAEVAETVGASPVYLTQAFQDVEAMPMYRYHLRLRLGRALALLGDFDDLTALSLELGFSSHSHFSHAFKQVYGLTPKAFRESVRPTAN